MKKAKLVFIQVFPSFVILVVLIFAGIVAYYFAPKNPVKADVKSFSDVEAESTASTQLQEVPKHVMVSPFPTDQPKVKVTVSLKATSTPTASPSPMSIITSPSLSATAAQSPTPSSNPSPSPESKLKVNIEIKTEDSNVSFSVDINDGMNVCEVMQKAKDEGKIQSITFDDTYLSNFKSRYILELNGHRNNWTFKVNGNSPLGCSLSILKPNDSIVWTFG